MTAPSAEPPDGAARILVAIGAVVALLSLSGSSVAQSPAAARDDGDPPIAAQPPSTPGPDLREEERNAADRAGLDRADLDRADLDRGDVEAFIDGYMASYLEESGAVGGVVSIVQDGRMVLAKGYGEDDREREREVDAARTLFRVGSVSKLFVWTAVMQLVEQGRLDLDADVNAYLGELAIPATFPEPVTLAHLMTHTPGFEDHVLGLFARDPSALRPLDQLLEDELPARVRRPGVLASYSNHGTGIAMLAVERVARVPWLEYLETRILEPLGMARTSFRQPPGPLADDVSKGYRLAGEEPEEERFEYIPLGPAGAASATATDMARLMIAHLQYGRLGEARILRESTARRMQRQLHRHAPGIAGMAHGFVEGSRNDRRVIGHGGDTLWFHTHLELYPEEKVGIFASFNTAGAEPQKLAQAFADRYFPAGVAGVAQPPSPAAPMGEPAGAAARAARFAGPYRSLRYSHDDFTKVGTLFSQIDVAAAGDGTLRLSTTGDVRWIEVEPLLFREESGADTIAFGQGRGGQATHLFVGDLPVFAFERVPLHEQGALHGALLGGAVFLFVATLVLGPAGRLLRWRYQVSPVKRQARLPFVARALLWLGCLVFVVFFAGLALNGDPQEVVFGLTPRLRQLLLLPVAGAALAASCLLCAIWIWRRRRGGAPARIAYSAVVAAFFLVLWQLVVWQFLG